MFLNQKRKLLFDNYFTSDVTINIITKYILWLHSHLKVAWVKCIRIW